MAETNALLKRHTGNRIEGSNPSVSASRFPPPITRHRPDPGSGSPYASYPASFTVSIATKVEVLATCGRLEIFSPSTSRYLRMSAVRTLSR